MRLTHTHYTPHRPPYQVPGTLLDCVPDYPDYHMVEGSELSADYMYTPRFGPHSASGLPDMVLVWCMIAYLEGRDKDTEFRIMNVARDDEHTYRVTITNRTLHGFGDGPLWNTEVWGVDRASGTWVRLPSLPGSPF